MESITFFKESLEWLKNNYGRYKFFMERDIVWTIQKHLREKVRKMGLPYRIVNDWPMKEGEKRSLCADLVIIQEDHVRFALSLNMNLIMGEKRIFRRISLNNGRCLWGVLD